MREAGVESETHAMGGTHEKGAIFPRLFIVLSTVARVSRSTPVRAQQR